MIEKNFKERILESSVAWILTFVLVGVIVTISVAGLFLLLPERVREKSIDYLISLAIGMLLGTAFLHLMPEALEQSPENKHAIFATCLGAIVLFFVLEKTLIWRHHHSHGGDFEKAEREIADKRIDASGSVILLGDSFHNFTDGLLIATAFLADFSLGVVTVVSVIVHEIPQELGDFAILIRNGFSRTRALCFNLLSSCAMVLGAVAALVLLEHVEELIPFVLIIAASSFIYVAMSDLIPALNKKANLTGLFLQLGLIMLGIAITTLNHSH